MTLTRRATLLGLTSTGLTACAPRAMITLVPDMADVGTPLDVFFGTTRAAGPDGQPGEGRSTDIHFGRYRVSIPPIHQQGQIELPGHRQPDPAKHFVVTEEDQFGDSNTFRRRFAQALRAEPPGEREVVVYVHGFNNTFADGIYRVAQISHDLGSPGVIAHYSWPSAANALRYAYDRDSVLFARDGLARFLQEVKAAGADRIILVAHSVGALLTMETLRQIEIERSGSARDLLHAVILFSPDIDVELFRSQAESIRNLPDPFVIFTSRRDRALALSARLTGQTERLGNIRDLSEISDLRVVVMDVSAFSTVGANHFALARSPVLLRIFGNIRAIDNALSTDQAGQAGLLPGTVLTLQNTTAIVLSPVTGQSR